MIQEYLRRVSQYLETHGVMNSNPTVLALKAPFYQEYNTIPEVLRGFCVYATGYDMDDTSMQFYDVLMSDNTVYPTVYWQYCKGILQAMDIDGAVIKSWLQMTNFHEVDNDAI